jgi:hypothetical protein
MRLRSSDVTSTATRRYIAAMPHATAPGFQLLASGTKSSTGPKCTYPSRTNDAMWMPTNTTVAPPRNRWRSVIQLARSLPRSNLVLSKSPQITLPAASAQARIPLARAVYHHS